MSVALGGGRSDVCLTELELKAIASAQSLRKLSFERRHAVLGGLLRLSQKLRAVAYTSRLSCHCSCQSR